MKFLIDAQLPRRLAHQLRASGFETTHTLDLPDGNRTTDQTLITFSLTEQCVVVTRDSDFVESFLLRYEPWKLLLVSTGNIGNVMGSFREVWMSSTSSLPYEVILKTL